jgi:hypothetical protein
MLLFYFGQPVSVEIWGTGGYGVAHRHLKPDRGFAGPAHHDLVPLGMHLAGFRDLSAGRSSPLRDASLVVPASCYAGLTGHVAIGPMVGPSVVFGYYDEWWAAKAGGADARFVDVGLVFAAAGVFALFASHDPKQPAHKILAYLVALALVFTFVQKGARGGLISFGIGAGWCYSQRVRRVRFAPILAVAMLAFLVLPVLREFRKTKQIGGRRKRRSRSSPPRRSTRWVGPCSSTATSSIWCRPAAATCTA